MAKEKKAESKARGVNKFGVVDVIIYLVLGLIGLCMVLPFLYVIAGSFATEKELTERAFFIIPTVWSLNAYK